MQDNRLSEIIKASLEGVRGIADVNTVTGNAIQTQNGVTVIPISKITVGFATAGVDYGKGLDDLNNFGGGGGTGISITPVAFLTINGSSEVNLIPVSERSGSMDKIISLIEHSPEIFEKIKNRLT